MKGIRHTVKVNGIQRECRFAAGTPKRVITAWKIREKAKLLKRFPVSSLPRTGNAGTFAADVDRYLPLVRHLHDWVTRRAEIRHWLPHFGGKHRHAITQEDVLRVRGVWVGHGRAAKTINNRVTALRDLFRKLDGDAPTPCDGVQPLKPARIPIVVVDPTMVNSVLATLAARAQPNGLKGRPVLHAAQDRARLMVLASTGKRPCEVGRAQPQDVDLTRRVWGVRDAKGGWSEGMYLNDEMLAAWQEFGRVEAWGPIPDHFERRLRDAGWPKGLKPYALRHSTWITASERGADLADIQAGAGHRNLSTTRNHYVPVLASRMQRLSELLDGRFGWKPDKASA